MDFEKVFKEIVVEYTQEDNGFILEEILYGNLSTKDKKEIAKLYKSGKLRIITRKLYKSYTKETCRTFMDFLSFMHNLADHPVKKFKKIEGVFLL